MRVLGWARAAEFLGPTPPICARYIALNSLCMPGLFYHFLCLMRTWGLDVAAPPMFGIYPTTLSPALLTETAPQLVAALSLYLLSYEFVYYWCARP